MEMHSDTPAIETKKAPRTYVPRHVFDRRTRAAKRFAKLVEEFTATLGGKDALGEARMAIVHQLAGTIVKAEAEQAALIRGDVVDTEQHVRLCNMQARLTRMLGLDEASKAKPKEPTLADHLAAREKAA